MKQVEEEFENPLVEDERPRRAPRRYEYAWEKVAAASKAPDVHFTCCGTAYGATSPQTLGAMRQVHEQSASHLRRQPRARLEVASEAEV